MNWKKTIKGVACGLMGFLPLTAFAQADLINNGANMVINSGYDVRIEGGIDQQNGGVITNNGNLYLDDNFTQTGATTTYRGSGWLGFEGAGNQQMTSATTVSIAKLRVDNGNRLVLGNDVNISSKVDLNNNGTIELGNFNLSMAAGTDIINYDAAHYIVTNGTGVLKREVGAVATIFPIGNSSYNPATLTNTGTPDTFRMRIMDQVLLDGTSGTVIREDVVGRTWLIDETVVGGSNVNMTLEWGTADELTGFSPAQSAIAHYDGGWDNAALSYTAANVLGGGRFTQTRLAQTSFSPFAVVEQDASLPVELMSFKAERINRDEVRLNWTTASELNNKGFEVERMIEGEENFRQVGFVEGYGNSSIDIHYETVDPNASPKTSYYRLKQLDFDGTYTYSEIRAVNGSDDVNILDIDVFPNPTKGDLFIRMPEIAADASSVQISIYNPAGQLIYQREVAIQPYETIKLDYVQNLTAGSYFVNMILDNGQTFFKQFAVGK